MIYLINPSEKRILDNAGDRIPIGLLSISAELKKCRHDVKVFDLNHYDIVDFWKEFHQDKPKYTGISVYTSALAQEAKDMAYIMKGKTKLIAGGHHATHMPESLTDDFDSVVIGEGENAIKIAMQYNGIIHTNSPDLKNIPNPDYDAVNLKNYGIEQSGKRTGTIITSRGCPYSCAFCGKLENKVRYEPISKVLEQAKALKQKGFEAVYFLDDVFTLNKERMKVIADGMDNLDMPYRVTTRANLVDEERMKILTTTGCDWLSLGIESGDNEILKKSNKGLTWEQNWDAVKLATRYGIKTKGFFILGLPGETEFTAKKTISFARNLKDIGLDKADFYFLTPFPGTPIWNDPDKFGIEIIDKDYTKYLEAGKGAKCYINTKELKAKRIEELVKEAKSEWK